MDAFRPKGSLPAPYWRAKDAHGTPLDGELTRKDSPAGPLALEEPDCGASRRGRGAVSSDEGRPARRRGHGMAEEGMGKGWDGLAA